MFKEKIAFYGDKKICEQLAFVLNLKDFIIIDDINKYNNNYKLIIWKNDKQIKKFIKNKKLKKNKDYFNMSYIYHFINKGYYKTFPIDDNYFYFNICNLRTIIYLLRPKINNIKIIRKLPVKMLCPSEMLILTLNDTQKNINCDRLENFAFIDHQQKIWGCCPPWVKIPFGQILDNKNPYNSYQARIIKLSSLNRTYSFCDFFKCLYRDVKEEKRKIKELNVDNYPKEVSISIDKCCNLKCKSCRKKYIVKSTKSSTKSLQKIVDYNWLETADNIIMAGNGEVFFSPIYRKMLTSNIKRKNIKILSNGLLFNEKNWNLIKDKYERIEVMISIDAATNETYKKLRGGNFNLLLKNLEMLSNLRKENKIKYFQINFVVQKDNYKEIDKFVKLGKKLNVDIVQFTKLNNWRLWKNKDYVEKSMIIDSKYLQKDLYNILKKYKHNKHINMETLIDYIKQSEKIYEKNIK